MEGINVKPNFENNRIIISPYLRNEIIENYITSQKERKDSDFDSLQRTNSKQNTACWIRL